MNAKSIFFNRFDRLRSGWRALVFLLAFVLTGAVVGSIAVASLSLLPAGYEPGRPVFLVLNGVLSLIPAIVIGWLCGKYLESLPFKALGAAFTDKWYLHFAGGVALGSATLAFGVLIAILLGGLSFEFSQSNLEALAISFLIFAVAAAFEEALFRGYLLQTFARAGLAWLAIGLISILFAAVHLRNPNPTAISTANTALAGIWFGVAYLKTRDLWFPFGIHLAWNWMQGSIFGIEVSGLTDLVSAPLLKEIDSGPVWLTGENYGVEGGIVTTIALVVSTAAIYSLPFLKPTDEMLIFSTPPYEGGVAAASADGVVF